MVDDGGAEPTLISHSHQAKLFFSFFGLYIECEIYTKPSKHKPGYHDYHEQLLYSRLTTQKLKRFKHFTSLILKINFQKRIKMLNCYFMCNKYRTHES